MLFRCRKALVIGWKMNIQQGGNMKRFTLTFLWQFVMSLCGSSFAAAADFSLVIPLL